MNLLILGSVLRKRGWIEIRQEESVSIYNHKARYLVIPKQAIGKIPTGTLETIFRPVYTSAALSAPLRSNLTTSDTTIILEKQDNQLWGRIEQPDSLTIACGQTAETVTDQLRLALNYFADYQYIQQGAQPLVIDAYQFTHKYDLTLIRELFQQFKPYSIAEQTGIPQELLSQFMAGKNFPSQQQARQLETLIRQLGQAMLKFSLV